jgi:diguanylate cyclase (GGDEF)-like protein
MSGAGFILAINLFVAGLFALAFVLVGANSRTDKVAYWFAAAYACVIVYLGCEFIQPTQPYPKPIYMLGFVAFYMTLAAGVVGVALRFRRPVPWGGMGLLLALAVGANWVGYDMGRDSGFRNFAYQLPYATLQAMAAWQVLRSGRRKTFDLAILAILSLGSLQFFSKPFVAAWTGGTGDSAQSYIATTYALYSQSMGAVLQVAMGLLMLTLLARDMLVEITMRSETDPLSGLYNRRGFEQRVEAGLASMRRGGLPVALVVCDLDHFKSVNDTYGHEMGDRVIATFAGILKRMAADRMTVARVGGEEFSIFMPGSNAAGARLFAEGVRAAFAATQVDGLPQWKRCTASFGVAEWTSEESVSDLRRRADAALYAAKRNGRDRVRLAEPALDAMPQHPYPNIATGA